MLNTSQESIIFFVSRIEVLLFILIYNVYRASLQQGQAGYHWSTLQEGIKYEEKKMETLF